MLGSNFHFILFFKFSFFQKQIFFLKRSWSQCSFKSRYDLVLCSQPSLSNNLRQPLRQTNEHLTQKPRLLKWLCIIVLRNCSPYPSLLTMSQLELNVMMMMMYSASQILSKLQGCSKIISLERLATILIATYQTKPRKLCAEFGQNKVRTICQSWKCNCILHPQGDTDLSRMFCTCLHQLPH